MYIHLARWKAQVTQEENPHFIQLGKQSRAEVFNIVISRMHGVNNN